MTDVATFLAHAVALEDEAAQRYDELADMMDVHNNSEVGELFRKMAGFSRLHGQQVRERVGDRDLPRLRIGEHKWADVEGPETTPVGSGHYLMTPYHAVHLALHNERRGQQYYKSIADGAVDLEVRRLAEEFASEEAEHVAELERWMERYPAPADDWDLDSDPPVIVD